MIIGVMALAGQVTVVDQEEKHEATMLRFLSAYAGSAGKKLLPFGIGAGVKTMYCCDRFYEAELEKRMERVMSRDPYQSSRDRAKENLVFYWLELEQRLRHEQSLRTHSGQRRLLEQVRRYGIRLLIIDILDDWTLVAGKETAEHAPASLCELLEEITSQGVSAVIFTCGTRGRKGIPALLGPLPCNKISIKEDKSHPIAGGLRLIISREASHDASPVPRKFAWWSKIDTEKNLDFSCREEHFDDQKSAVQEARDERREKIKVLIAEGATTQKELAEHLDCEPSTINRGVLREMIASGEVLKDPKTKKLSLPGPDAPLDEDENDDDDDESTIAMW
ncbi:hypothetical protein WT09_16730 [Burkholderia stagnalis]|nr:hypothetical protein WT09_16730 [Burkholderia stagnalis]